MVRILFRNWLLLLAALLQAMFAAVNLIMQDPNGSLALRRLAAGNTALFQAKFAVAAGLCTIAAGLWGAARGSKAGSWLLAIDGLALSAYGLVPILWTGPLQFRPYFALLLVGMAISIALLTLDVARRHVHSWLSAIGSLAALGFALAFLAMDLRWLSLDQPGSYFAWLTAFFALSAACLLGIAFVPATCPTHGNPTLATG